MAKVSTYTRKTSLVDTDGIYLVESIDGTPVSKAATLANLKASIKLDDLATPDDNTDLNASSSRHGLLKKLSGVATEYQDGSGNWSTPAGAAPSIYPTFTAPVDGDFAWVNQETATVDTSVTGQIYLLAPSVGGEKMRIRKKAAPSAPYTITAAILPNMLNINYATVGLGFRESSSGKTHELIIQAQSNLWQIVSQKHSSATSADGAYTTVNCDLYSGLIWLQISDDNTNRICRVSRDGRHFIEIHSIGRTNYITANEVFFYANSIGAPDTGMALLSWKEE